MSYIYTFLTGLLIGVLGGVLVVRNNKAKAEALDQKATAALDSLKK